MKSSKLRWLARNYDYCRIPLNATERADRRGDIPYWGANGIVDYVDGSLINDRVVLIGEDGAPFFERDKNVAFISNGPIWPNNHIHILKPNPRVIDDRFLCYFLNQVEYAKYITGSTRDKLTQAQLGSIFVNYPDLDTQKMIAKFLDRETSRIDQLIQKRVTFLSLIEEKKASIAARIVDGSIFNDERAGLSGWFGTLPSAWKVRRAKFLFRERQNRSEAGEEELLTVSHITGVTKRSDKDVNMFLAESNEGYKLVFQGDVVINTMWAWMGAMGVSPEKGLISPSYGVYAPITGEYEFGYLDLLLRSGPFVAEATRRSKGIHSSRLRLYPDAFLDMSLPVPSKIDQRKVLEALKTATERDERLAAVSRQALDVLNEFRAALITSAVTGQVDIATWGKRGKTDRRLDQIAEEMPLREVRA